MMDPRVESWSQIASWLKLVCALQLRTALSRRRPVDHEGSRRS